MPGVKNSGQASCQAVKIRAEEAAIMLWNRQDGGTAWLSDEELKVLNTWAGGGAKTSFVERLQALGLLIDSESWRRELQQALTVAATRRAPQRSFYVPESVHVELTTRCPLQCPQCYKGSAAPQDLPYERLGQVIGEAAEVGVLQFALGGGEPLAYPYLLETVGAIASGGLGCSITTSGVGLTAAYLDELLAAGLNHVQVSLNGSTQAINGRSRQGFAEAVQALNLLAEHPVSRGINWVARKDNFTDLEDLAALAMRLGAQNLNVLAYKPAAGEAYQETALAVAENQELLVRLKQIQRKGGLTVKVDSAYSNLLCALNGMAGTFSGCGAGRRFLALDADGAFRPCSHVSQATQADSLMTYWQESIDLTAFRQREDTLGAPCASCRFLAGCRGCAAIMAAGSFECGFWQPREPEKEHDI